MKIKKPILVLRSETLRHISGGAPLEVGTITKVSKWVPCPTADPLVCRSRVYPCTEKPRECVA